MIQMHDTATYRYLRKYILSLYNINSEYKSFMILDTIKKIDKKSIPSYVSKYITKQHIPNPGYYNIYKLFLPWIKRMCQVIYDISDTLDYIVSSNYENQKEAIESCVDIIISYLSDKHIIPSHSIKEIYTNNNIKCTVYDYKDIITKIYIIVHLKVNINIRESKNMNSNELQGLSFQDILSIIIPSLTDSNLILSYILNEDDMLTSIYKNIYLDYEKQINIIFNSTKYNSNIDDYEIIKWKIKYNGDEDYYRHFIMCKCALENSNIYLPTYIYISLLQIIHIIDIILIFSVKECDYDIRNYRFHNIKLDTNTTTSLKLVKGDTHVSFIDCFESSSHTDIGQSFIDDLYRSYIYQLHFHLHILLSYMLSNSYSSSSISHSEDSIDTKFNWLPDDIDKLSIINSKLKIWKQKLNSRWKLWNSNKCNILSSKKGVNINSKGADMLYDINININSDEENINISKSIYDSPSFISITHHNISNIKSKHSNKSKIYHRYFDK